jgi:predicted CopG family antitoxin
MRTKLIGIREDVYERLEAQKREGESVTDTIDRLPEESTADWREGYGTLDAAEAADLERVADRSRRRLGDGLPARQDEAAEELTSISGDETA